MTEEGLKNDERSGHTGHFDLDEMGLSDEELDIVRARRKSRVDKSDGFGNWNDPWGGGSGGDGGGSGSWAADYHWTGDDKPDEDSARKSTGESGTAAIDLEAFRKHQGKDNAMSLDEGGADDWDEGWDASGWSGGGDAEGTAAIDINSFNLGSNEKGIKGDNSRGRVQAASGYDRGNDDTYSAGRFNSGGSDDFDDYNNDRSKVNSFYDDDISDARDGSGWSSSSLVDESALPKPADVVQAAGGGDATAAIDLSMFMGGGDSTPEAEPEAEPDKQVAAACLIIFAPEAPEPVQFELRRGVTTIGRGFDNNIVLSDVFASRKHSVVLKRGEHFEVQDAGSDNGTTINGHPVSHARLRFGDHIEIGSTFLRFAPGAPSAQDLTMSSPPQKPPHHLKTPPAKRKSRQMSTGAILALFSLIMVVIVSVMVVLLLQYAV